MPIIDAEKHFETIWSALECWAEDCVSGDAHTEEREDVNHAMACLREAVNAPDEVYDSLSMLRDIIKASDANDHGSLMEAILTAKTHIEGIDQVRA